MAEIQSVSSPAEWAQLCRKYRDEGKTIGFVPTMGALHNGHGELMRRSCAENDITLISIFVNPAQFNDAKDLEQYPRTVEDDMAFAAGIGVKAVFLPTSENMYPDGYTYRVQESEISTVMEGEFRPGHYDGMLTVVLKLLLLTRAHKAYFGEKDFQQFVLIRRMQDAFFLSEALDTQVLMCPLVREPDGLAMSSRNARLSTQGREKAPELYRILRTSADAAEAQTLLEKAGFEVEYILDTDQLSPGENRRFAAVFLEGIRLIDTLDGTEIEHAS